MLSRESWREPWRLFGRESWWEPCRKHCLKHCLTCVMRPTDAWFEACRKFDRAFGRAFGREFGREFGQEFGRAFGIEPWRVLSIELVSMCYEVFMKILWSRSWSRSWSRPWSRSWSEWRVFEHIAVRRYRRHVAEGKSTLLTMKNEVKQCTKVNTKPNRKTDTSLKIEWLTVIGLASVTSIKESTILQRIKIRFSQASEKGSKSVTISNCVAN